MAAATKGALALSVALIKELSKAGPVSAADAKQAIVALRDRYVAACLSSGGSACPYAVLDVTSRAFDECKRVRSLAPLVQLRRLLEQQRNAPPSRVTVSLASVRQLAQAVSASFAAACTVSDVAPCEEGRTLSAVLVEALKIAEHCLSAGMAASAAPGHGDACVAALRIGLAVGICEAAVSTLALLYAVKAGEPPPRGAAATAVAAATAAAAAAPSAVAAASAVAVVPAAAPAAASADPPRLPHLSRALAALLEGLAALVQYADARWPAHASCNPFAAAAPPSARAAPRDCVALAAESAHALRERLGLADLVFALCATRTWGSSGGGGGSGLLPHLLASLITPPHDAPYLADLCLRANTIRTGLHSILQRCQTAERACAAAGVDVAAPVAGKRGRA